MSLPVTPPVDPMLARLRATIPRGDDWVYEPKWDGFRAIGFIDSGDVHIASRDHKPLQRYFPELPGALAGAFPERCVVDGEVIVTGEAGLDFDALLQRIHPARSRIEKLAAETPAAFVAFDLLALHDEDLRDTPLAARRKFLEDLLGSSQEPALPVRRTEVLLTPQTRDADRALAWMSEYE
ncbi:MAG: ATP-dependent DNA ligase, partial [Actinomycetota bacterium]